MASKGKTWALLGAGALLIGHWASADEGSDARLSGGTTTVFVSNKHSFGKSAANLPVEDLRRFAFGNRLFNTNWVKAPASVKSFDGLGPIFNRVSCSGCHVRDGRGRPPESPDDPWDSMLIRLSVRGADGEAPGPHPVYGGQLQDRAVQGFKPEGRPVVRYTNVSRTLPDGTLVKLQNPSYEIKDLEDGPLGEGLLMSPRVAPAVHGLGLLEAVAAKDILSRADPKDEDQDGVSGRPNWIPSAGGRVLGRFGWKANQPSLLQQAAGAANGDLGLTTGLFPEDHLTPAQLKRIQTPNGGTPELSDEHLAKLVFYLQALGVPARRDVETPEVQRGEALFTKVGCASCHTPTFRTLPQAKPAHLANQTIHPYTDLLLHDMGEELSDQRPDHLATGEEWRTPPLWGLGLQKVVNGHTRLLHDGRARNALEAVLWHGGEAESSRRSFEALPSKDRTALIRFLDSL